MILFFCIITKSSNLVLYKVKYRHLSIITVSYQKFIIRYKTCEVQAILTRFIDGFSCRALILLYNKWPKNNDINDLNLPKTQGKVIQLQHSQSVSIKKAHRARFGEGGQHQIKIKTATQTMTRKLVGDAYSLTSTNSVIGSTLKISQLLKCSIVQLGEQSAVS